MFDNIKDFIMHFLLTIMQLKYKIKNISSYVNVKRGKKYPCGYKYAGK